MSARKKAAAGSPGGLTSVALVGVGLALVLGLCLVWLNIERVDTAYRLRKMEGEMARLTGLNAKLEVERDNLLSPHRLADIARERGFEPASGAQIRRVEAPSPSRE